MSSGPDFRASPAESLRWRVLNSLWLIIPVVGFACLGAAALIYVGARLRRAWIWIPGIVYLAVSVASFPFFDEPDAPTTNAGDWAVGTLLAVWLATIVHSLVVNPAWLRWRAGHVPWFSAPAPVAAPPLPSQYYAPERPAASVVDVNAATPEQLRTLPGFDDQRSARIVAARQAMGRFSSIEEFAAAAGLAPHEFARLREVLVVRPSAPPPPTHGRIVDV